MVADPEEAFIFHILPNDNGTSAIWVAARVPDTDVAIVANMFVVRHVNLSDSVNFLGSPSMFDIAGTACLHECVRCWVAACSS